MLPLNDNLQFAMRAQRWTASLLRDQRGRSWREESTLTAQGFFPGASGTFNCACTALLCATWCWSFRRIGATETDERLCVRHLVTVAPARAQIHDAAVVAAAAQHAPPGYAAQLVVRDDTAGHRVGLRAIVVCRLPFVEHELPDIPGHVVEAEPIRRIAADRRRAPTAALAVVRLVRARQDRAPGKLIVAA